MMTQTEIANVALDEVGKQTLNNISDTTPSGELVRRHFDMVSRRVIAEPCWWEFDTTIKPSPNAAYDGVSNTHDFQFSLPNYLVIRAVWDTNREHITDYNLEGEFIYVDESDIYFRYVPTNVQSYPEYIGNAIAYLLAARMAKKAESTQDRTQLYRIFKQELSAARKISKTQMPPHLYGLGTPYSFINARVSIDREDFPPATFGT